MYLEESILIRWKISHPPLFPFLLAAFFICFSFPIVCLFLTSASLFLFSFSPSILFSSLVLQLSYRRLVRHGFTYFLKIICCWRWLVLPFFFSLWNFPAQRNAHWKAIINLDLCRFYLKMAFRFWLMISSFFFCFCFLYSPPIPLLSLDFLLSSPLFLFFLSFIFGLLHYQRFVTSFSVIAKATKNLLRQAENMFSQVIKILVFFFFFVVPRKAKSISRGKFNDEL